MCGIAGLIHRGRRDSGNLPQLDLRPILRRGPDSHGTKILESFGNTIALGHSRLSIIDLSELGQQPMHDHASGWWISYNGEVYNYIEIRMELRALGWTFSSDSDTEVVLKAWAQWGLEALPRFNGMFAFAFLHCASGQLWLVRDRFGVKPLCWGRTPDDGFAFSSSVADMANRVGDELDIDYCARGARYKVYETARTGSPFRQVKSVPAGSWVKFQLSDSTVKVDEGRWYDLRTAVAASAEALAGCSDKALIDDCRFLLKNAVEVRLRSDVPVAVSLSGGLDSSSVAALASRSISHLAGFTYGSPDAPASEGPEVEQFARVMNIDVRYVWPDLNESDMALLLERTLAFQEAPFSNLSQIAQNEVCRRVRDEGYKVLLGGQGGDEVFAGYRKFFVVALREAIHGHQPWNAVRVLGSLGMMLASEGRHARVYWENRHRYLKQDKGGFRLLDWEPAREDLLGGPGLTLTQRLIDDILQWSLPSLLRYEDRNSMGFGIETRLPFMDYRLIELALALPSRLRIRNGYAKWALRSATAGIVPDPVRLNRKKRGFDVTQAMLSSGMGARLRSQVFDHRQALAGHLRPGADLDRLLSDEALEQDGNLLCEALMLAWLVKPVRSPVADYQEHSYREKSLSLLVGP